MIKYTVFNPITNTMITKNGIRMVWKVEDEHSTIVTRLPKIWVKPRKIEKNSKIEFEINEISNLINKPGEKRGSYNSSIENIKEFYENNMKDVESIKKQEGLTSRCISIAIERSVKEEA